jgi:energy-coupling factor transporter ATP-binding protein EcfA2
VSDSGDELPAALSLGTQQCVSLARALARAEDLLLDEPFAQLDSLTRFELQDVLLGVCNDPRRMVVMVTHDVDEALYLADRLILMTDGPEATVGDVLRLPFPRPRSRKAVLAHPEYPACYRHVIDFLEHHVQQFRPSPLDDILHGGPKGPRYLSAVYLFPCHDAQWCGCRTSDSGLVARLGPRCSVWDQGSRPGRL